MYSLMKILAFPEVPAKLQFQIRGFLSSISSPRITIFSSSPNHYNWRRGMEIPAIEPLNLHGSSSEIQEWIERFEVWCSIRKGGMQNQSALFLTLGGRDLYSLVKNLAFPDVPAQLPFDQLKSLLVDHILPVDFQATERAKFNSLVRAESMSCREFLLLLNKQASKCNYGDHLHEQLCDRLIAGINDIQLQRRLLEKKDLKFAEARKICEQHDDLMATTSRESITLFHQRRRDPKPFQHRRPENDPRKRADQTRPVKDINECMSCGQMHLRSSCRFRNATCHACGKVGHIRKVCRQTRCNLTQNVSNGEERSSPIYTLRTMSDYKQFIYHMVTFKSGSKHRFIVDTGSGESIISRNVLQSVCPNAVLEPTSTVIHGVTGHRLPLLGETTLWIQSNDTTYVPIQFLVSHNSPSILGLSAMRTLGSSVSLHTNEPTPDSTATIQKLMIRCSENSGGMRVPNAVLHVDGEPVFLKRRVIPYGQRDGVRKAIERMEQKGIISRVASSTWATPIVVAMKSDGSTPRICGDYRLTLNPRLRKSAATTMETEDFMKAMHGSQYFSKIDLADAYLQIPLHPDSKHLTTINTPWGLFQFNFLPFGLHVSSGIFQSTIDDVISGLQGVMAYQDDVIVFATSKEEHDKKLINLLEEFVKKNVCIKPSKCIFGSTELEYLGFTVGVNGYRPDPSRFKPLMNMQSPKDQNHLRSIMGYLQYYSRFIPNFATKAQPLFAAQSNDEWNWTTECERILRELIQIITDRPLLASFSPSKSITLVTDASELGIGAVLEQEGTPVMCISRLLNSAEKGYSQTQKEALAVFWAVRRLHKYLFGMHFTIVTDHHALQFLFNPNKSVAKTTAAMLQRWSIALGAYNYEIQHRPGKAIPHADFLSRHSNFSAAEKCNFVTTPAPVSREALRRYTKQYYSAVISALSKGWRPDVKKKFPLFFANRDELVLQPDGILSRGDRLIIPPPLRKAVLDDLHKGHLGVEKMKSLARQMCWWPELDSDVATTARNCEACLHKQKSRPKNWTPWPESYAPWQRVHADFCGPFLNRYYALVMIDSYSKWPEVFLTSMPTTSFVIQALRKCFSREGIPQVLVTDNGSQFCSGEMKTWLDSIGCRHLRTAPRHPCSNGAAENLVKTVKNALASANPKSLPELEAFLDNFLLQYRNAAHTTTKESPARLFKSRALRSSLRCLDSSDVTYFRGNDIRPTRGIITRNLGHSMVEITDLEDATVHRRHIDQLHFKDGLESTPEHADVGIHNDDETTANEPTSAIINTEDEIQRPIENPASTNEVIQPTSSILRRSTRKASQIDEALLREESCGDPTACSNENQWNTRYTFQTTNRNRTPLTNPVGRGGSCTIGPNMEPVTV